MVTEMNNRSDKGTDLKIREINPGFHFMKNEASTAFKVEMTTMDL